MDDSEDDHDQNTDDWRMREFGQAAGPIDKRRIATLLKRYYSIAADGDGFAACSLIYAGLARDPSARRTVPEDYLTAPPSPPVLRGETCARAATLIFRKNHQQLATDIASLQVTAVRVSGDHGLALLGFRTTPERWMPVVREGRVWKIDSLLDRELP